MELEWKLAVIVTRQPVVVTEASHDRAHTFADGRVIVAGSNSLVSNTLM
jgi:Fe-S cluster assembly ATPase SufC